MSALAVVSTGMVTALGFNAAATLCALRAGISGVRSSRWMDFEAGQPLRAAKVPLPHWWEGTGKLAELLAPAVSECLQAAQPENASDIPVLVGVACEQRAGRFHDLSGLLPELAARLELELHPDSELFPLDEVGCVQALRRSAELIAQRRVPCAIVAGVDSFLHQPTLDHYMRQRRLLTTSNSNGFLPGEAGGAMLVTRPGHFRRDELHILGMGLAHEPATIESEEPFRAVGMTAAVKLALSSAGIQLKDVACRITDLTGEHYKFKEAAFVAGRLNGGEREQALDLWHPSEYLGAVGAAVLPCLLGLAMHAAQHDYAPGPLTLCHLGSDDGARAAMVVRLQRVNAEMKHG